MFRNQPFLHLDEAAANLPGLGGARKPQDPNLRILCAMVLAGALALMLSAAMAGLLVRTLLQVDQGVRIVFTGSFLAFLALLAAAVYTAYAERQHEIRLAQYDEKRQMDCDDRRALRAMGQPLQQTVYEGPKPPVLRRYK